MGLRKGSKVYFKPNNSTIKGYRQGVVLSRSKYTLNKSDRRIAYRIKPTDAGRMARYTHTVVGSKVRRRR
jgi:hypothetical protein